MSGWGPMSATPTWGSLERDLPPGYGTRSGTSSDSFEAGGLSYDAVQFGGCMLLLTTNAQAITTATDITLLFNSEVFDTMDLYDAPTANGTITIPRAGIWRLTGCVQWNNGSATGYRRAYITSNSRGQIAQHQVSPVDTAVDPTNIVTTMGVFPAEDTFLLKVHQTSGAGLNVQASLGTIPLRDWKTFFSAEYLGPTPQGYIE